MSLILQPLILWAWRQLNRVIDIFFRKNIFGLWRGDWVSKGREIRQRRTEHKETDYGKCSRIKREERFFFCNLINLWKHLRNTKITKNHKDLKFELFSIFSKLTISETKKFSASMLPSKSHTVLYWIPPSFSQFSELFFVRWFSHLNCCLAKMFKYKIPKETFAQNCLIMDMNKLSFRARLSTGIFNVAQGFWLFVVIELPFRERLYATVDPRHAHFDLFSVKFIYSSSILINPREKCGET